MSVFDLSCPVCLELIVEPITLPCGHNICMYCEDHVQFENNAKLCCICRHSYNIVPKINIDLHTILMNMNEEKYKSRMDYVSNKRMIDIWQKRYFSDKRSKLLQKKIVHLVDTNQKMYYDDLVNDLSKYSNNEKEILIALKYLHEKEDVIIINDEIISIIDLDRYMKDLLSLHSLTVEKALYLLIKGYAEDENDLHFLYNICSQDLGPKLSHLLSDEKYYSTIHFPFLKEYAEKNGYDSTDSNFYFPNNPMNINGDVRINKECITITRGNTTINIPKLNLRTIYTLN